MATEYVILRENGSASYFLEREGVQAANAAAARRMIAEEMNDEALKDGVTLIAVPARNWRTGRGTLKAETQRRIRPA